jgi:multiple sugar transport system permease protein
LPVAASLFVTDIGVDRGKVMAMGSLIALLPLIFTFVAARQILTLRRHRLDATSDR